MTKTATPQADAYVPGVCNINRAEIAYRQKTGYVITVIYVVMLIVLISLHLSVFTQLILFIPGMLLADCFLQAKNKFCVAYGAAGQQNANEGSSKAVKVTDNAAAAADKKRARAINLQAAGYGLALTLFALATPVIAGLGFILVLLVLLAVPA